MSLSLPPEIQIQAAHLSEFHDEWPAWDESVLPWGVPVLGGHGVPIPGWDPDTLMPTR